MAFDKVAYNTDYIRKNLRQFMVKVSRIHEPELVEWLEGKDNVQAYIKGLIKADMEKSKQEQNHEVSEAEQFVIDIVHCACQEDKTPMTYDDAAVNLSEWKKDGVDVPEGLTAQLLMKYWNEAIK